MTQIMKIAERLSADVDADLRFISHNVMKARYHALERTTLDIPKVHLIDETCQRGGSFKYRGAVLSVRNSRKGVVACGSGNFPIAVGQAASVLGVPALLVMPDDAPLRKQQLARQTGSELLLVPRKEFVQAATKAAITREWEVLHPFQDPTMLLGSCTLGIEIAENICTHGSPADAVVVACGGGGLAAGVAIGLRLRGLSNALYIVEPETHPRLAAARLAGRPVEIVHTGETICDALQATRIGDLALEVIECCDASLTTASDDSVLAAQSLMVDEFQVFPEPSGALALGAVLESRIPEGHERTWVVVCGGNI